MKKNLYVGVDYIGDEEIRVGEDSRGMSKWEAFTIKISKCLNSLTLLNRDLIYIEARYDKTITNFFVFFKFIVDLNVLTCFGFLYLLIYHILKYNSSFFELCDTFYPCAFFYSRF